MPCWMTYRGIARGAPTIVQPLFCYQGYRCPARHATPVRILRDACGLKVTATLTAHRGDNRLAVPIYWKKRMPGRQSAINRVISSRGMLSYEVELWHDELAKHRK